MTAEDMQEAFNQITNDKQKAEFQKNLELDLGYSVPDVVRVRCNAAVQRGTISMAMRLIPTRYRI